MQISANKFSSLSPAEQAVIKKLGIVVSESPPDPFEGKKIIQSYITLVETSCRLCNSTSILPFSMEGLGTTLKSRQIKFEDITPEAKIQTRQEHTSVCGSCRSQLLLLSKEDLIELAIKKAKGF